VVSLIVFISFVQLVIILGMILWGLKISIRRMLSDKNNFKIDIKSKIRFISQDKPYNCGPVAIFNALRFFGVRVDRQYLNKIEKICNCDRYGTTGAELEKALKYFKKIIKFQCFKHPNLKFVDNQLKLGNAIILNYIWFIPEQRCGSGHFALICRKTKTGYIMANERKDRPTSYVSRKQMVEYLSVFNFDGRRRGGYCWIISKT
jgi:hypothetical protein